MGGSLTLLCDILMIKNGPDRQFLTPPVTFTLDNFYERKKVLAESLLLLSQVAMVVRCS